MFTSTSVTLRPSFYCLFFEVRLARHQLFQLFGSGCALLKITVESLLTHRSPDNLWGWGWGWACSQAEMRSGSFFLLGTRTLGSHTLSASSLLWPSGSCRLPDTKALWVRSNLELVNSSARSTCRWLRLAQLHRPLCCGAGWHQPFRMWTGASSSQQHRPHGTCSCPCCGAGSSGSTAACTQVGSYSCAVFLLGPHPCVHLPLGKHF